MSTIEQQASQLEAAIASLEAQRTLLGDAAVDLAVSALRQQLSELQRATASPPSSLEGEYRLVTIMFADLAGFTPLTERLGPEQVRNLMNACFEQLVPVIERYEGTIDKFLGDGLLALFGAPVVHENDAERALRAALEMKVALGRFNQEQETDLDLHFGINTGEVVAGGIGSEGRQEYSVMGDPVNLAARLEDLSERGEILVGPDTYRLTAALFDYEPLPPVPLKGKAESVVVHRLLGLKRTPGSVRGVEGLRSPLVGRDAELQQFQAALRALQEGRGSRIVLLGEAGQGKSRLVAEARQALPTLPGLDVEEPASRLPVWAEGRALSYTEGMSYWLARDLLRALVGVTVEASPSDVTTSLHRSVERLFRDQIAEVYPYLARLLELPMDTAMAERVQYLSPEMLQQRMLRAVGEYVRARAMEQPLVLVWEDLHWADPSSLHLLESLLPLTDEAPLCLLMVSRPEVEQVRTFHEQALATYGEQYPVIELAPLTRAESTQLLQNLLQIENLPEATRQLILDKAEGNAFFLEEVLRSLIDAGLVMLHGDRAVATQAIEAVHVPDTLQGVIMARIDRLSPGDKRTLQTASVIGRVFQRQVLAYLMSAKTPGGPLDPSLAELRRRELIRLRTAEDTRSTGTPLDQEYIFKHVVTQDVTYNSLLLARRKELHQVTGEAIETLFADHLEELSATLGYHFQRGDVPDKAVRYLAQAGDRARTTYANDEATAFYRAALHQAERLISMEAEAAETWREAAVHLQENLGDIQVLTGQFEGARAAYDAAGAVVPRHDVIRQARFLRKTGNAWASQRRFLEARQVYATAETVLGGVLAEENPDGWHEWIELQLAQISLAYFHGDLEELIAQVERLRLAVEQNGTPRHKIVFFGCLEMMAIRRDRFIVSDEILGYTRAKLAGSRESGDLKDLTIALFSVGFCCLWYGALDEAEEKIRASLALAERTGDVKYQSMCLTYLTVLYRKRGQLQEVRDILPQCLEAAATAQRCEYTAAARANAAWVAWREGALAVADQEAQAALENWHRNAVAFPLQWLALWPLLGAALAQDRLPEAVEQARALLAPTQQPPPEALLTVLEAAIQAAEDGQLEAARAHLAEALSLAAQKEYL